MTAAVPRRRAVWILFVAALLPYLNALPNDFTLDDQGLILENEAVATFDIASFWGQDYWAGYDVDAQPGLYRPLTLTTFAAEYATRTRTFKRAHYEIASFERDGRARSRQGGFQ